MEYDEAVHQLFVDFKKDCDSVMMEVMCNILFHFGIPVEMVKVIKRCQNKTYNRVRVDKNLSEMFLIENGSKKEMLLLNFVL